MMQRIQHYRLFISLFALLLLGLLVLPLVMAEDVIIPQPIRAEPQGSPLHPAFRLLDADGVNVVESGEPLSTMQTCGTCHDATFIASHSFHADVGLNRYADDYEGSQPWDTSPGLFGKWNPLTYRYLSSRRR